MTRLTQAGRLRSNHGRGCSKQIRIRRRRREDHELTANRSSRTAPVSCSASGIRDGTGRLSWAARRRRGPCCPLSARAEIVAKDDPRLHTEWIQYPAETGAMRAYLARPKEEEKRPAVIVIHENRGLHAAHPGCGPAHGPGGISDPGPRRPLAAGRDAGRSRQGPGPLWQAGHRGDDPELRRRGPVPQDPSPLDGKGRVHGLLLGRRHDQPGGRPLAGPGGGGPVLRQSAGGRGCAQDQGRPASPLRGRRRTDQQGIPAFEEALKKAKSSTRSTSTRGPGTRSTTTRTRNATTRKRPNWPGRTRSHSSRRSSRPDVKPEYRNPTTPPAAELSKFEFRISLHLPQQFLYFLPLPQGQGSLRPLKRGMRRRPVPPAVVAVCWRRKAAHLGDEGRQWVKKRL